MLLSESGVDLICEFESFQANAYPDIAGIWTIGYGTTRVNGQPVVEGMTCTIEEAKAWMAEEVHTIVTALSLIPTPLTQNQFDAIVSMAYNIGVAGFHSSTLYKKIMAGQLTQITKNNFTDWNKISKNGQLIPSVGLTNRRVKEYALFIKR